MLEKMFSTKESLLKAMSELTISEFRHFAKILQVREAAREFGIDLDEVYNKKLEERKIIHAESEERSRKGRGFFLMQQGT